MAITPTTWNPADKEAGVTLSNGNLTATSGGSNNGPVRSVFGASSGKWYWELTYTSTIPIVGVALSSWVLLDYPGYRTDSLGFYGAATAKKIKDAVQTNYGAPWSSGAVLGVMLDMDAGTIELAINGVSQGVMFTGLSGTYYAASGSSGSGSAVTANFGATSFAYTPPSGYVAGFGPQVYALSGNVKDASGANAARLVRAYREDTGAFVAETTSNGTTGNYSIGTAYTGAHTLVFYPAGGESLPALVLRGVMPV